MPAQRGHGQTWWSWSPIVKPKVLHFAKRKKNLKSTLLSKTLQRADPSLALPWESIPRKRQAVGSVWRNRERDRWQSSAEATVPLNDSPLCTSLLACGSQTHALEKFCVTSSHGLSVCSHSKPRMRSLQSCVPLE